MSAVVMRQKSGLSGRRMSRPARPQKSAASRDSGVERQESGMDLESYYSMDSGCVPREGGARGYLPQGRARPRSNPATRPLVQTRDSGLGSTTPSRTPGDKGEERGALSARTPNRRTIILRVDSRGSITAREGPASTTPYSLQATGGTPGGVGDLDSLPGESLLDSRLSGASLLIDPPDSLLDPADSAWLLDTDLYTHQESLQEEAPVPARRAPRQGRRPRVIEYDATPRRASLAQQRAAQAARTVVEILTSSFSSRKKFRNLRMRAMMTDAEIKDKALTFGRLWQRKAMTMKRDKEEKINPYIKFRRISRAVALVMKVCRICKDIVTEQVSGEEWYSLVDNYIQDEGAELYAQQNKRGRPFVTFVPDENRELVQLTFDKSEFSREFRADPDSGLTLADHLLNDEIRDILRKKYTLRTEDEHLEILRFMKRISTEFNAYPLYIQRQLVRCLFYDKYLPNRVITRQGVSADGVYFVLSGTLIEKSSESRGIKELKPGDRFGEEELVCGCMRKATIITRTSVEMLSCHRFDYRAIFNMADDTNNPKHLEVTKHDIVFQHFPIRKLVENPGVWTVLSYKFGRLIVMDSNELEWIYIIKSGEARVIKHLTAGSIDLNARRNRIKEKFEKTDAHYNATQMINFVASEGDSTYNPNHYHPPVSQRLTMSAPARRGRQSPRSALSVRSLPNTPFANGRRVSKSSRLAFTEKRHRRAHNSAPEIGENRPKTSSACAVRRDSSGPDVVVVSSPPSPSQGQIQGQSDHGEGHNDEDCNDVHVTPQLQVISEEDGSSSNRRKSASKGGGKRVTVHQDVISKGSSSNNRNILITPSANVRLPDIEARRKKEERRRKKGPQTTAVPPFVQLESLHSGKVFGMRACLEPEERGPSASLVSGGCEVVQINKKFFMKHVDEAVFSLIRVQHKPFPTEEDLIDRLDANIQWAEFKRHTVVKFLAETGRTGDLTYGEGQAIS